jgi:hypothetical protein
MLQHLWLLIIILFAKQLEILCDLFLKVSFATKRCACDNM